MDLGVVGGIVGGAVGGPVGAAIGSAIGGRLARMVPNGVEGAMAGLMQQVNDVESLVAAPLRGIMDQISGGVWRGAGADAFLSELSTVVLPEANNLMSGITAYNKSLGDARQKFEDTDGGPVVSVVVNLDTQFNSVLRF